ncbi:unnamed protein product, partial [marine sediment metagenome]
IWLKEAFKAGVEWKGYQYRDRNGKIEAFNLYLRLLEDTISRMGKADKKSRLESL